MKGNVMKSYKHLVKWMIAKGYTVSVFDGEEWAVKRSTKQSDINDAIEAVANEYRGIENLSVSVVKANA